jgi:hypothetical protein
VAGVQRVCVSYNRKSLEGERSRRSQRFEKQVPFFIHSLFFPFFLLALSCSLFLFFFPIYFFVFPPFLYFLFLSPPPSLLFLTFFSHLFLTLLSHLSHLFLTLLAHLFLARSCRIKRYHIQQTALRTARQPDDDLYDF